MARWGTPSSPRALMDATKKRAQKLDAKDKAVDFKELLRPGADSGARIVEHRARLPVREQGYALSRVRECSMRDSASSFPLWAASARAAMVSETSEASAKTTQQIPSVRALR